MSRVGSSDQGSLSKTEVAEIEQFCADCHRLPRAESFPKDQWHEETKKGFDFYRRSGRNDLSPPAFDPTLRYFRDRAPERLEIPKWTESSPSPVAWEKEVVASPWVEPPAIAQLLRLDGSRTFLITEMRTGEVRHWSPDGGWSDPILTGDRATRATPVDWDDDGDRDWLVAEIGAILPRDSRVGSVSLWLNDQGKLTRRTLATRLGRTVEALPIDWDGDGDKDVFVAEFGMLESGALTLLRNPGNSDVQGEFPQETIDRRHGAIGARIADLDGDGLEDVIYALAQEHESLEVLRQVERGRFEPHKLLALDDPSYGTSWFELVDLDVDGQLDILFSNGDSLDSQLAKPFHAVRWLKNLGDMRFEEELLGYLPGAHQSAAGDFDGDGDLDVAAVSFIPIATNADLKSLDSVVWFERRPGEEWVRHPIETGETLHGTVATMDVDNDGRLDLIVGGLTIRPNPCSALTIFRNLSARDKPTAPAVSSR